MTEKLNVDEHGAQAANPGVSGKSVENETLQLSELVKEIKSIKSEISGIYSRQDKDRNQFREFMDDFQRFKAGGMTDEAAYRAAESGQNAKVLEKRLEELEKKFTSPTGNGTVDAVKVIQSAGLDMEDPRVKVLAGRSYANDMELYAAIGQHVATKPSNHNPAQNVATPLGTGKASSQEDLWAEYERLHVNPTANSNRIKELAKELELE